MSPCHVAEMGTHIQFNLFAAATRTYKWEVETIDNHDTLGFVSWFGRWRCYAFFPNPGTAFEKVCLREIAGFCERKTEDHRRGVHP